MILLATKWRLYTVYHTTQYINVSRMQIMVSRTLFRIIPVQWQEVKGSSLSGCIKDDPISRSLAGQQLAVILCISQHAYRLQRILVEQNKVRTNIMVENQNTKRNINVRTQTGRFVYESRESGATGVKWPWINWRSLL